jgi:membrane-anchored protein YejM (alkaline phosphatase superfamily)
MDRTAFAGVPALRSAAGPGRVESNRQTADAFVEWLGARASGSPFFAFLWFNHTDTDIGPAGTEPAPDGRYAANPQATERWRHYRRGLRVIDDELGRVLGALERQGRSADTLVMVMGDHGFEFDDLGLGYYGHASNYARFQLQTPLLMRWPGREPRSYTHRTSHLDLPATLLQELFGCTNPPGDYSMGRNLFAGESWDWIIAGSYHSYAIVEPHRILLTTPGGFADVLDPDYRLAEGAKLDPVLIEKAFAEMRRFYR